MYKYKKLKKKKQDKTRVNKRKQDKTKTIFVNFFLKSLMEPKEWTSMPTQHESNFPIDEFKLHVRKILRYSGLDKKYIRFLTNEENIKLYVQAVTHPYFAPMENYEWFEMMGDAILNKCMVYYINHRFPFLHNHQGVKVIARLKINLVSKKMFAEISCRLGFPTYIRFIDTENLPKVNPKSLFEDVLESFFGLTEWLMDQHYEMGSGHVVCYRILKTIMDAIPISLKYEDLFDNITRLKETFDMFKVQLGGHIRYENTREENIQHVSIYQFCPQYHQKILLYQCSGVGLDETKQKGAGVVIEMLKKRGICRPVPSYYLQLDTYLSKMRPIESVDSADFINFQNFQKSKKSPAGFLVDTRDILTETESLVGCNPNETHVDTAKSQGPSHCL